MKANIEQMMNHPLYEEYGYMAHKWINEKLNCGCIRASCIDIQPLDEDVGFYTKKMNELGNLRSILKTIEDPATEQFQKFQDRSSEIANELQYFIRLKRKQYGLSDEADFNGDNYFIKIYQSPSCKIT
jgi:hypothetical protein